MGLSNYLPSSRISQSGVCTSTTRPASPFEGQVIYETDTDRVLVWNASAWVMPNQTTQNPTGLELITTVTGSSPTTTIDVNNVFSSQYNAYRIVISGGTVTGIVTGGFQLLDSGGTPSATEYYEVFMYSTFASSGTLTANTNNGSSFLRAAAAVNDNDCLTGAFDVMNPFLAKLTHYYNAANPAGGNGGISIGYHNVATSYTGFRITASVTNGISGTAVSVYGYRK